VGRTLATTPASRDEGSKQPAAARNSQEVVGAWEGRGEVVWEEGDKRLRGEEGYSTAIQRCSTHWQPTTHSISMEEGIMDSGQEGRAAAAGSSSLSVTAAITQSVTLLPSSRRHYLPVLTFYARRVTGFCDLVVLQIETMDGQQTISKKKSVKRHNPS
jgi:hypothetical protein